MPSFRRILLHPLDISIQNISSTLSIVRIKLNISGTFAVKKRLDHITKCLSMAALFPDTDCFFKQHFCKEAIPVIQFQKWDQFDKNFLCFIILAHLQICFSVSIKKLKIFLSNFSCNFFFSVAKLLNQPHIFHFCLLFLADFHIIFIMCELIPFLCLWVQIFFPDSHFLIFFFARTGKKF